MRLFDWLTGDALTEKTIKAGYQNSNPSLPDRLAIADFSDEQNLFLLNDGVSIGSGFELASIPAEAASPEHLESVFNKIRDTFAAVLPLHKDDPWVMQMYVNDEYSLKPVLKHISKHIEPDIAETPFTKDYLARLDDLFSKMERPEGLFLDPKTDMPYRGRRRRVRVLFYRQYKQIKTTREQALIEHRDVMAQIESKLKSPGLQLKQLSGKDYYAWWVRWFNPGNVDELLRRFPYPEQAQPAGYNLAQAIFFSPPESNDKGFVFDGQQHRILYVDGLREAPETGLLSREKQQANPKHRYALLDKLPEGATYTIQVTFSNDEALDVHLMRLEKGIVGTSLKPQQVRNDIRSARDELSIGNRLFWVNQAIYYRAKTDNEAMQIEKDLRELFIDAKMPLIPSSYDLHPLNSYLNALPFNFVPSFARQYLRFDRLMYASELAALLPVYGRNQGARHLPCLTFFNRLGEPVLFDPLHTDFISQNSHMALFANSGGGKSVAMGWIINSLMATKNARIVLFEMGNSFDRILVHCREMGKVTKQLLLSNQKDKAVPLNPFCEAYKAIPEISDQLSGEKAELLAAKIMQMKEGLNEASNHKDTDNEECRSYMSELALALRTMITEANEQEEKAFTLADETLLIEILSDAILTSFQANIPQMLTEHVVAAFARRMEKEVVPRKKDRILDMHDRLKSYVINSNKARFFNVPTEPLGDFDIFHVDISAIKDDKGKLALVMVSLLPRILAMAEASQHDNRPTFLFLDESHIQFQIPTIVICALLIAKVARKLGLWLVPSTQNVTDMNSEMATKILSLIETWILLGIDEKELIDVQKFQQLTPEQIALIRDIDSQKGLYAEAVLLGARYQGLFRVIPTRYILALLLNEKSEKAERHLLEAQYDVLKAAEIVAHRLENKTQKHQMEACFYED
ncbi:conjugative transfer ATPase [Legionella sp. CNM-4043-24]|uniref:conjugative transfer ATPase n=1 Tax=Legionella sp. CNM-4043-24 TaxID=3421646 RepID=UPI00403AF5A2